MNYIDIFAKLSKLGSVFQLRGESKEYIDGYNSCLYFFKRIIKNSPSLNLAIENRRLIKEMEELKKQHKKEIVQLEIQLDDEAHKYAELEKKKTTVITKTVKVKEMVPVTYGDDSEVLIEYGFKKPVKLTTTASKDFVMECMAKTISSRIKCNRDAYNERALLQELVTNLNKQGYKTSRA